MQGTVLNEVPDSNLCCKTGGSDVAPPPVLGLHSSKRLRMADNKVK